jgi:SOS response regulatory protein OraA/RecX
MNRQNKTWTAGEVQTLKKLHKAGSTDKAIAEIMGRTRASIQQARVKHRMVSKTQATRARLQYKEPTKGAKYTRYMKPSTEVSILWGLIKYTKA